MEYGRNRKIIFNNYIKKKMIYKACQEMNILEANNNEINIYQEYEGDALYFI
jgi:hypothetical protein